MSGDFLVDAVQFIFEGLARVLTLHGQHIFEGLLFRAQDLHLLLVGVQVLVQRAAQVHQAVQFALQVRRVVRAALSVRNAVRVVELAYSKARGKDGYCLLRANLLGLV